MERRKFIKNAGFLSLSLALLSGNSLAQLIASGAYDIKMLTDRIGIFKEKGGTIIFMYSKNGNVLVDTQFPDSVAHLKSELEKKDNRFKLIINTHHHGDHTAGNIAFKEAGISVLAHINSKKNQEASAAKSGSESKQYFPTETFTESTTKKIDGEKIKLSYFGAGHTDGDCFVHFKKANIVHVGDLVFNRRHPFVDKDAGADIGSWIEVLSKATQMFGDCTYVCGHAGDGYDVVIKKTDIMAFQEYLRNVMKFTREQIAMGKSLEEILKAKEIPGSPEWKGDGIERPLKASYTELTMK